MSINKTNANLLNQVQFIAAIVSILTPLLVYFSGIKLTDAILAGYIFCGFLAFLLILLLARQALSAWVEHKRLPPPAIFWKILFHKLAPVRGSSRTSGTVNILVIYDASTKENFDELIDNFRINSDHRLNIKALEYGSKDKLDDALRSAQALYLFLGQEIGLDKVFQEAINKWSERQTQIPILVVNKSHEPYTLPFDIVPSSEATKGLWYLLVRSIERTTLWHEQATDYRLFWFLTFAGLLVFLSATLYLFYRGSGLQQTLHLRDQSMQNQPQIISRDLQSLREEIASAAVRSKRSYSLLFTDSEVGGARSMIARLHDGSDPLSGFLRRRLKPETVGLLDRLDASGQPSPALTSALVKDLNCLLRDAGLFQSGLFHPSAEAKELQEANPKGESLMRLNRILFEGAYSELLPRSKDDPTLKAKVQSTLNNYALYSYKELVSRMSEPQAGEGHLSFWRMSPDKTYYQQVARSHAGQEYRTFDRALNPIVKCAIENNAFTLWVKDAPNGDPAAWSLDGTEIGQRVGTSISFQSGYPVPSCERVNIPGDDQTTGLLCVGMNSIPYEAEIKNGVCIDVPYKDASFLKEAGSRNYLLQTLSVMHLFPDEVLKFDPGCKP
jgi:hypothetical protein